MQFAAATGVFIAEGNPNTIPHLTAEKLRLYRFPKPPRLEQIVISAFLNAEIARIDELIDEQRRLIGLLTEKRQAVISHAVTKGLNANAPMKPSGVEWLGDVPTHWEVGPIKRHWHIIDCKHITPLFLDEGFPLASIREVQGRWVDLHNAKRTTEDCFQQLIEGGREPRAGDLIFSRNATVGEVAQVSAQHSPFALGQDVVLLRRQDPHFSPDFLQHAIRSSVVTRQIDTLIIGSTFKRINVEEVRSLLIAWPPPSEQAEIAPVLEVSLTQLEALRSEAERGIHLLEERRTALISAAVTGQIDVRGRADVAARDLTAFAKATASSPKRFARRRKVGPTPVEVV